MCPITFNHRAVVRANQRSAFQSMFKIRGHLNESGGQWLRQTRNTTKMLRIPAPGNFVKAAIS